METEREETLALLVEACRRFAREVLVPAEVAVQQTQEIPAHVVRGLRELGLFGMTVPEEYGGLGLNAFEETSLVTEICYAQPAFRSFFGTTNGVGTLGIINFGTEAQKLRYLPRLASGEMMASFALTEPDSGSDAASLQTRAVRDGDHWVINGTKRFITNAIHAGVFTVFARTGPKELGANGISAFLVRGDAPGVVRGKPEHKLGQHGSTTTPLDFNEVELDADALLGEEGRGFRVAMMALDGGRIGIAALALGCGLAATDFAADYALQRSQFGAAIASYQAIQWMLADSATELDAARLLVLRAAWLKEQGKPFTSEASMAKLMASERAHAACDRAVQVLGGYGYVRDFPVERFLRDVRVTRIFEGTSEIQRIILSREVMRRHSRG